MPGKLPKDIQAALEQEAGPIDIPGVVNPQGQPDQVDLLGGIPFTDEMYEGVLDPSHFEIPPGVPPIGFEWDFPSPSVNMPGGTEFGRDLLYGVPEMPGGFTTGPFDFSQAMGFETHVPPGRSKLGKGSLFRANMELMTDQIREHQARGGSMTSPVPEAPIAAGPIPEAPIAAGPIPGIENMENIPMSQGPQAVEDKGGLPFGGPRSDRERAFMERDYDGWLKKAKDRHTAEQSLIAQREAERARARQMYKDGKITKGRLEEIEKHLDKKKVHGEQTIVEREDAASELRARRKANEQRLNKKREATAAELRGAKQEATGGKNNFGSYLNFFYMLTGDMDSAFKYASQIQSSDTEVQKLELNRAQTEATITRLEAETAKLNYDLQFSQTNDPVRVQREKDESDVNIAAAQARINAAESSITTGEQAAQLNQARFDFDKAKFEHQKQYDSKMLAQAEGKERDAFLIDSFSQQVPNYFEMSQRMLVNYGVRYKDGKLLDDDALTDAFREQSYTDRSNVITSEPGFAKKQNDFVWAVMQTPGTHLNKIWTEIQERGLEDKLFNMPTRTPNAENMWMSAPRYRDMLRQGIAIGPNVGDQSSLLNRLMGEAAGAV